MIRFCARCGASLTSGALYCGECGALDQASLDERSAQASRENRELRRRGLAVVTIVIGALGSLLLGALVLPDSLLGAATLASSIDVLAAVLALALIGKRSWRHALGRRPGATDLLLAIPVAAVTFGIAWVWVELLWMSFRVPDEVVELLADFEPSFWIVAVLLAPLGEEWLCRGALWTAVRPVTTRGTAILATALVFAFLHGLNGLFLLESPHRLAMGLALGWLRATTASIWPCVLAHAIHNAVSLALAG